MLICDWIVLFGVAFFCQPLADSRKVGKEIQAPMELKSRHRNWKVLGPVQFADIQQGRKINAAFNYLFHTILDSVT